MASRLKVAPVMSGAGEPGSDVDSEIPCRLRGRRQRAAQEGRPPKQEKKEEIKNEETCPPLTIGLVDADAGTLAETADGMLLM